MKNVPGGGFLFGSGAFRALTAAPAIQYAANLAHRMARRRLEAGGAAASTRKHSKTDLDQADIVLPVDIDPVVIARALRTKLGADEGDDALWPLEEARRTGGAAPAAYPAPG